MHGNNRNKFVGNFHSKTKYIEQFKISFFTLRNWKVWTFYVLSDSHLLRLVFQDRKMIKLRDILKSGTLIIFHCAIKLLKILLVWHKRHLWKSLSYKITPEKKLNSCKVSEQGKRSWARWEDNVENDFRDTGSECVNWIEIPQNRIQQRVVNTVMNFWVS
jgi:hypothetical protein